MRGRGQLRRPAQTETSAYLVKTAYLRRAIRSRLRLSDLCMFPDIHIHALDMLLILLTPIHRLDKILRNLWRLKTQIGLLTSLRGQSSDEEVVKWCRIQSSATVTSIRMAPIDEIPALVSAAVLGGLSIVEDTCVPLSSDHSGAHAEMPFRILPKWGTTPSTFKFWVSLIKELYKNKGSLDAPLPSSSTIPSSDVEIPVVDETKSDEIDGNLAQEYNTFERTIGKCFDAAIRQWDSPPKTQSISGGTPIGQKSKPG